MTTKPSSNANMAVKFPIPPCSPFHPSSDLAKVFAIIYACRITGVSCLDLFTCYRQWTQKDVKAADYDISQVFAIGTKAGWIVEKNGMVRLILDEKSQKLGGASSESAEPRRTRTGKASQANASG